MRTSNKVDYKEFFSILNDRMAQAGKTYEPLEYVVSDKRRLVYLVNSKVACSSIKSTFLDTEVPDNHSVHKVTTNSGLLRLHLSEKQSDYFSFSFVRNPFSRLVSCYESKYHTDPIKYGFFEFRNYLFGFLSEDDGFDTFVKKVCSIPPRLMDRHFRPQYDVIYDSGGNCRCDYVGHFESLEEDFSKIQKRFNLHPLPHLNKSPAANWRDYYSDETLKLVRETFQKDFETFGYEDH